MSSLLRAVAEHEAGHAVVAAHLGYRVTEIRIASGSGSTVWNAAASPSEDQAAVTAAGDLWCRELSTHPYVDLACDDLAAFERSHGLGRLWHAQRTARQILTARRDAVSALAERLMQERSITFGTQTRA